MKAYHFVLVLALLSVFACKKPKEPSFKKLEQVKLKAATLKGTISLSANAILNNPNPFGVDITQMDIDVFIDGKEVATIKQDVTAKMAANSDFALPLNIDIPIKDVFSDLKGIGGLLSSALLNRTVTLKMDGHVKVKALKVNIKVPVKSEQKQNIL